MITNTEPGIAARRAPQLSLQYIGKDAPNPMRRTRVIPCLLLRGQGLVKTVAFREPTYLGDPVNIVRIFNEKEVDEVVILDITATPESRPPNFSLLADIAGECLMPLGYGGGLRSLEEMRQLFALGFEKVVINTAAIERPEIVLEASQKFGSQSVVVSIDARRTFLGGYDVYTGGGRRRTRRDPADLAREMEERGAGEILINSIDRDGTMQGYDLKLIRKIADAVDIPVVACGGAGKSSDLRDAVVEGHASATAAGSFFVFQGRYRAVLINVPTTQELQDAGVP